MVKRQIKIVISSLSQGLWTPNLAGCLVRMSGSPKIHVTLQFCSHMAIWKRHISSTTGPMASNLAGCGLRLRGCLIQSQMTVLFRGQVTETSLSLLSSLSHGLWSVAFGKDEKTSLQNIYNSCDTSTTWQIENVMPNFFSAK